MLKNFEDKELLGGKKTFNGLRTSGDWTRDAGGGGGRWGRGGRDWNRGKCAGDPEGGSYQGRRGGGGASVNSGWGRGRERLGYGTGEGTGRARAACRVEG